METLYPKEKRGINKVMVFALLAATVLIGLLIWLLSLQPSIEEQKEQILAGALREGTPEFEKLTKEIIITTDAEGTTESPTGLGTIMMSIPASIRNKSDKTISLLQVNLGVVDQQNKMIKSKDVIVVPGLQAEKLPPNDTIKIVQTLDGFDPKADRAMVRWRVTAIKTE
ncbi:MAG: hypothetical protein R2747_06555 [Pyrinomonadaceae bacterium]